jgi:hypothetical protein
VIAAGLAAIAAGWVAPAVRVGPAVVVAWVAQVVRVVAIEAETLEVAEIVSATRGSRAILAVTIAARSGAVA